MKPKTKFTPTSEMIEAARDVFLAMAFVETIRPIVENYQRKILAELEVSQDLKLTYLLPESILKVYYKRCNEERVKAGLKVESEDHCPLLVAEDLLRKAQRVLVDTMEPITKLSADAILSSVNCLENYKQYVDLTLRLLVPFVDINKK